MTVTYTLDVSKATFWSIHKVLLRWKASVWKAIYMEMIVWIVIYTLLSMVYRVCLNNHQRIVFEQVVVLCDTYSVFIPITFMLGFYVSMVVTRWWEIFNCLAWIDNVANYVATYIQNGNDTDEEARMKRRSIVRYMVIVEALVLRDVAPAVRKRFPTVENMVIAGLMTEDEKREFDSCDSLHPKYWLPFQWAMNLVYQCEIDKKISDPRHTTSITDRLREYKASVAGLVCYDWVPVPLVYTQVVNLAVRSYFLIAIIGRQYLQPGPGSTIPGYHGMDLYFPFLTILQFICYMGWMKVAEALLNPLGEDDDDLECNWIIDRNLQVGLNIVDNAHGSLPLITKDKFWNESIHQIQPLYTEAAAARAQQVQVIGSCNEIPVPKTEKMVKVYQRCESRMTDNRSSTEPNEERSRPDFKRSISAAPGRLRSSTVSRSSTLSSFIKRKFLRHGSVARRYGRRSAEKGLVKNPEIWVTVHQSDHSGPEYDHDIVHKRSNDTYLSQTSFPGDLIAEVNEAVADRQTQSPWLVLESGLPVVDEETSHRNNSYNSVTTVEQ